MLNTLSHSAIASINSVFSFRWPAMLANALELSRGRFILRLHGPSLFIKFEHSFVNVFHQCLAVPKTLYPSNVRVFACSCGSHLEITLTLPADNL